MMRFRILFNGSKFRVQRRCWFWWIYEGGGGEYFIHDEFQKFSEAVGYIRERYGNIARLDMEWIPVVGLTKEAGA